MAGKELAPRPAAPPPVVNKPPYQNGPRKENMPAYRWIWNRRHWTVPVLVIPSMWITGLVLHTAHAGGYTLLAGILLIVFVTILAPHKWERRPEQAYAVGSATVAAVWLDLAAEFSLFSLWLVIVLVVFDAAWGYFWWRHKRPRGYRRRQKLITKWDAWWQSHAWNWQLGGSRVVDVREMNVTTKVRIQGMPGRHTVSHVREAIPLIESGADGHADIGMIRVEAVKGKPHQFDLFLKRENPLKVIVEFDMALTPKSVHEPMPVGKTETGEWKTISPRRNRFVIGETRSGKSNDLLVGLASLTGCKDDYPVLIDLKGGRSARPVLAAGAVAYVITEVDEARLCLRMFEAEALARAKYAYTGEEQLLATDECPALHLLIDEVNGLTSVANGDTECAAKLGRVASLGNGVEEYVWVYTQHGSLEESVRTEQTRANLPCRTCYRVAEARHGQYAIPEWNKLDASKLEEKGTCYIKDGKEATVEQVRAPLMSHPMLRKIAAQNAKMLGARRKLVLYCGAQIAYGDVTWQQWWDTRWSRLDEAFHDCSPQYAKYVATMTASSPAEAFQAAAPARAMADSHGVVASEPGEGTAAQAAERMRQEMEELEEGYSRVTPPGKGVNLASEMERQKDAFAEALSCAGQHGISPKGLMSESGLASTWVHTTLQRLITDGVATRLGRGRYAPIAGKDVREAIRAIESAGERLYQEAREKVHAA